ENEPILFGPALHPVATYAETSGVRSGTGLGQGRAQRLVSLFENRKVLSQSLWIKIGDFGDHLIQIG
ncbi:MAG TPA: hypothetical protein PKX56_09210, partial [Marmoricola sp.]|nr:hypothetical protein [Marmoricola sp.]